MSECQACDDARSFTNNIFVDQAFGLAKYYADMETYYKHTPPTCSEGYKRTIQESPKLLKLKAEKFLRDFKRR